MPVAWKSFTTSAGGVRLAKAVRKAIEDAGSPAGVYLSLGGVSGVNVVATKTSAFAPADPTMFRDKLYGKKAKRTPQAFWSLSGRTRLISPPVLKGTAEESGDVKTYSELPLKVQGRLWQTVAIEADKFISKGMKVWVITHGRDVPWLHIRIEIR